MSVHEGLMLAVERRKRAVDYPTFLNLFMVVDRRADGEEVG